MARQHTNTRALRTRLRACGCVAGAKTENGKRARKRDEERSAALCETRRTMTIRCSARLRSLIETLPRRAARTRPSASAALHSARVQHTRTGRASSAPISGRGGESEPSAWRPEGMVRRACGCVGGSPVVRSRQQRRMPVRVSLHTHTHSGPPIRCAARVLVSRASECARRTKTSDQLNSTDATKKRI